MKRLRSLFTLRSTRLQHTEVPSARQHVPAPHWSFGHDTRSVAIVVDCRGRSDAHSKQVESQTQQGSVVGSSSNSAHMQHAKPNTRYDARHPLRSESTTTHEHRRSSWTVLGEVTRSNQSTGQEAARSKCVANAQRTQLTWLTKGRHIRTPRRGCAMSEADRMRKKA